MDGKNRAFWLTAAGASLTAAVAFAAESEEAAKAPLERGGGGAVIWILLAAVIVLVGLVIVLRILRTKAKKHQASQAVAAYKAELDAKRAKARELKEAAEEAAGFTAQAAEEEEEEEEEEVSQEEVDEAMDRMAAEIEEAEAQVTETAAAVAEELPEPVDEVLSETAHEVIPASIDGKQIYRFFPDVVIDPANYDVSSVQLGQPVSFVSIGKNLFAQSRRKIIGRVTKKSLAEKITAWQLDRKLMAAVITDADASDGDLKVTIAFYDDLLKVAEEKGAKMIKLSATKNEEAQENIVRAKVGDACSASFDKREDNGKEDRWKVYTADGYVGVLPEDSYYNDGSLRIVVAEVSTSKKDDKASIWVYVV